MSRSMVQFLQAADPQYKNPILSFPITATDRIKITAGVAVRYTIPDNVDILFFNSVENLIIQFGDSSVVAEIPDEYDSDILDGTAAMLNPGPICSIPFAGYTHASVICAVDCYVYIQRWARRKS